MTTTATRLGRRIALAGTAAAIIAGVAISQHHSPALAPAVSVKPVTVGQGGAQPSGNSGKAESHLVTNDRAVAAANFAPLVSPDGSVVEAKSSMQNYLTATLLNVDTFWKGAFAAGNLPVPSVRYQWPIKGTSVATMCADSAGKRVTDDRSGFYCSADDTIIVSEEYARKLWNGQYDLGTSVRQSNPGEDFGVATLIAHEYAHQVQNEMGWDKRGLAPIALEQQADCLAGVWAHYSYDVVQPGDIAKAFSALTTLADDDTTDQNHGRAPQRIAAFNDGYSSGVTDTCTAKYLR